MPGTEGAPAAGLSLDQSLVIRIGHQQNCRQLLRFHVLPGVNQVGNLLSHVIGRLTRRSRSCCRCIGISGRVGRRLRMERRETNQSKKQSENKTFHLEVVPCLQVGIASR